MSDNLTLIDLTESADIVYTDDLDKQHPDTDGYIIFGYGGNDGINLLFPRSERSDCLGFNEKVLRQK